MEQAAGEPQADTGLGPAFSVLLQATTITNLGDGMRLAIATRMTTRTSFVVAALAAGSVASAFSIRRSFVMARASISLVQRCCGAPLTTS